MSQTEYRDLQTYPAVYPYVDYTREKHPLDVIETGEIRTPTEAVINVGPQTEKVYIIREDVEHVAEPMAGRLMLGYNMPSPHVYDVVRTHYADFVQDLNPLLLQYFKAGCTGNVEIHHFNADRIDRQLREKAEGKVVASMDPLLYGDEIYTAGFSRLYYRGGLSSKGVITRPGCPPLEEIAQTLQQEHGDTPVALVEDDLFTGGSLVGAVELMRQYNLNVQDIIVGLQVGDGKKLREMGLNIDAVHRYRTTDGSNIFDKVDLGDPRDFLAGASGLVIDLGLNRKGRAPYMLPYVSASARASIPRELEEDFSRELLNRNKVFFQKVSDDLGVDVLVEHMEPDFVSYMTQAHGIDPKTPMVDLIDYSQQRFESLWHINWKTGEFQKAIEPLKLPANMAFVKVSGGLISEHPLDPAINDEENTEEFRRHTAQLSEQGVTVGFSSDAPLPQLLQFAENMGISTQGPMLAEKGAVLYNNGQVYINSPFVEIEEVQKQIEAFALQNGYTDKANDPADGSKTFGFGEGRMASIGLFCDQTLSALIQEQFGKEYKIAQIQNGLLITAKNPDTGRTQLFNKLLNLGHQIVTVDDDKAKQLEHVETRVKMKKRNNSKPTYNVQQYMGKVNRNISKYLL